MDPDLVLPERCIVSFRLPFTHTRSSVTSTEIHSTSRRLVRVSTSVWRTSLNDAEKLRLMQIEDYDEVRNLWESADGVEIHEPSDYR